MTNRLTLTDIQTERHKIREKGKYIHVTVLTDILLHNLISFLIYQPEAPVIPFKGHSKPDYIYHILLVYLNCSLFIHFFKFGQYPQNEP
jgi:hypothetical protein